jgi:putative membrane protein
MLLFWVALIGAVVWLLVRTLGSGGPGTSPSTRRARELLAERFARGEMTVEEYRERLDVLR